MTVTYTAEVATSQRFGTFLKLLLRWRGSIYKLVWVDLVTFLTLYYLLSMLYRYVLDGQSKHTFEGIVLYCSSYASLIPLSFVLGFYVNVVMERWWSQYINIPWPDDIAVLVSAHIQGQDDRGRLMRRTIMRYVILCQTIVLSMISPRVKRRFPKLEYLVDAGLLMESEKKVIELMNEAFPKHPKYWMPIVWAASIISRARREGRIRDDIAVKTLIDELNKFRGYCGVLLYYDFISIPLVYTQVVTLGVYTYFLCSVVGTQWTSTKLIEGYPNLVDRYFPVFTTLQFFFYMGWLKVAETLINPFGDDDDDFEVNWMIDRNLQVSYLIVDEMHHEHPELVKDQYWDEVFPNELPYSTSAGVKREDPPEASTAKIGNVTSLTDVKVDDNYRNIAPSRIIRQGMEHMESTPSYHGSEESSFSSIKDFKESSDLPSKVTIVENVDFAIVDDYADDDEDNLDEKLEEEEEEMNDETEDFLEAEEEDRKDAFELLRLERARERTLRQVKNITRTLGNAAVIMEPETNNISSPADHAGLSPKVHFRRSFNRRTISDLGEEEFEESIEDQSFVPEDGSSMR